MPRWDETVHPKYRIIEMGIIRNHLKKHCGVETSMIPDEEFLNHMVELQKAFDDMRMAVNCLNVTIREIPKFFWSTDSAATYSNIE